MRLLFLGDIVGKTARISIAENLLIIKKKTTFEECFKEKAKRNFS